MCYYRTMPSKRQYGPNERCKNNHEPDWYISPKGWTVCRVCKKESVLRYQKAYPERYRAYQKKNRQEHLEERRAYDRQRSQDPQRKKAAVARRYSLTVEQYDKMWVDQDFKCAICPEPLTNGKTGAHVDHDHSCCSGKTSCGKCVRGILCSDCSNGIARFKDDPELLSNARAYLWRYSRGESKLNG